MDHYVIELIIGAIIAVIGWFAAQKDAAQQREIEALHVADANLQRQHEHDVAELNAYKIKVAENYHTAPSVDARFTRMEHAINKGFDDMREDIRKIFDEIHGHGRKGEQ